MPFITQENRDKVEKYRINPSLNTEDWAVGDWCYSYYKLMVDEWKANPRWTTAHNIYRNMRSHISGMNKWLETLPDIDDYDSKYDLELDKICAYELAWQVFFQNYVMIYEKIKETENGTI